MTLAEQTRQLGDKISDRYGDDVLERVSFRDQQMFTFNKEELHEVLRWTRDALGFDMLIDLCTVDHFGDEPRFEVVYTVTQSETGVNLTFKTRISEEESVPTVTDLYQAANWHEREAWDLMGIKFDGHPDLRRILMWEEYPYHPLRKDFPVEGIPVETEGVAFAEVVPTEGEPFRSCPVSGTAAQLEPRSQEGV